MIKLAAALYVLGLAATFFRMRSAEKADTTYDRRYDRRSPWRWLLPFGWPVWAALCLAVSFWNAGEDSP